MDKNGLWVTFDNADDNIKLSESVKDVKAGWKIKHSYISRIYLNEGKVYVYYSKDALGKYTIPRLCIVVGNLNRVRYAWGIASYENIEFELLPILEEKLDEINDKKFLHKPRINDLNLLDLIDKKTKNNEELTLEEIKFLYEFEREIKCFGTAKDQRIIELRKIRNVTEDMNRVFRSMDDYEGDLNFNFSSFADGLEFPRIIKGNFSLNKVRTLKNCKLPEYVKGNVNLPKVKKLKNIIFQGEVLGDVNLESLEQADHVIFPEYVGGSFISSNLMITKSVVFPNIVINNLHLSCWDEFKETIFSKEVGGSIYATELTDFKGLVGLKTFNKLYTSTDISGELNEILNYSGKQNDELREETKKRLLKATNFRQEI